MSLKPAPERAVPEETHRVAKAAFPKGNVYLWMRDELGELYADNLLLPCIKSYPMGELQKVMPVIPT